MSNEYEQRVNPLTAFLHEQAIMAEHEKQRENDYPDPNSEETDSD